MGDVEITGIPDGLHEELRRRAAQSEVTVSNYVLDLIRRDQLLPTRLDWLEEVAGLEPVDIGMSAAEAVDQARAERDAELSDSDRDV